MKSSIPVSIIIPIFNEGKYLNKLLESCVAQNVQEVFIGDNCSTDETEEICRYYDKNYPCIRYVRHSSNLGVFENYWYLVNNSSCDYVALTGGHDFYINKDHFKRLFGLCKNNPEASGAFTAVKYYNTNNKFAGYYNYTYAKDLENEDVFERVNSLVHNLTDGTILYGLFKKSNILGINACIKDKGGIVDVLWIGSFLAKGKLLYAPDIFFGRRIIERSVAEQYKWYDEAYGTNDFPGFWLKQVMTLVKMIDITEKQRHQIRQRALSQYEHIRIRYESR